MGRPKDPRGRDKSRSITLTGDVAEIAQKLADEGSLSRILSNLLMKEYGLSESDKISQKISDLEQTKSSLDDEIDGLWEKLKDAKIAEQKADEALAAALQAEENRKLEVMTTILMKEKELERFIEKVRRVEAKIQTGKELNEHGFSYKKQKENFSKTIEDIRKEIDSLEGLLG